MRKLLVAIMLVAIAAVGVALYLRSSADTSTKVKSSDIKVKSEPKEKAGLRPEPGKYEYTGGGRETVSVLGGGEHELPKTFTATVELGKGCEWTLKLYYLDEHRDRETWCTDEAGIDEVGYDQSITFFGSTEKVDFTCEGGPLLPADAKPGDTVKHTCSREDRAVNRVVTIEAPETMSIGGTKVNVTPVVARATLTGATKGTSTTRWWLMETGQSARYSVDTKVRSKSILGDTDYTMKNEYTLTSLDRVD